MNAPVSSSLPLEEPDVNKRQPPVFLVKLGGSFLTSPPVWPVVSEWLKRLTKTASVLVVVGGGARVRQLEESSADRAGLERSHWQAIEIMRDNARWVAGQWKWPLVRVASGREFAVGQVIDRSAVLLLEDTWLSTPMLPVGWEVTSDSIATWVGFQLGVENVVLTKQVNPLEAVLPAARMSGLGWVDQHFPRLLLQLGNRGYETRVWIRHFPPKDLRPSSLRRVYRVTAGDSGPDSAPMDRLWTAVSQGGTNP